MTALGRTAEAEGEKAIWQDLRARLYMDPDDLRTRYASSPAWLKRLMDAWADGLNYYLATHPQVRPRSIARFEPWMALSFSEGSIGGDIEQIDLAQLEAFYSKRGRALAAAAPPDPEPRGSNGFAIAPAKSESGKALLLINPHTSFFFRSELQMTSDEGLNAYGAATWGQFFIYQGFNAKAGWMHTSSGVDAVDEFLETIEVSEDRLFYRYGAETRPVQTKPVTVAYRVADGSMASRTFETYATHHGPIVREANGRWVAFAMMHRPVEALSQSYLRTKADGYASFLKIAELKANSSNNTIFADAQGNIAYLHPQFIPVRDARFDYSKPVDGSDPATDWKGVHALADAPHLLNPANGWIQNTNNWPYSAAGSDSPRRETFPPYMDQFGENHRGLNAVRVLARERGFTLQRLRDAAYDPYQPAFAELIPGLVAAWDRAPPGPLKSRLTEAVGMLRGWDYRWDERSIATTLAMVWAEPLYEEARKAERPLGETVSSIGRIADSRRLQALGAAMDSLERDFGTWRVPWGDLNRFQRLTGDIVHPFSDSAPSIPVPFTSGRWGSLASFGAAPRNGTKRWYGTGGNSFVAVVEFGDKVRALAVTAGGESGDPASPHFNDQAQRYATGDLRPVYFYPEELRGHSERTYRPGR
jgi:acyl-homoserine-lactone acylase